MMPESYMTSTEVPAAAQKAAREKKWLEENREAIEYCNKHFEENGLALEEYRTF
jgi:post-segregation antitoxin (ccd killing protein)